MSHINSIPALSCLGLDLGWCAFGTHLGHLAARDALGRVSRRLGLFSLLLALSRCLLLLALLDGLLPRCVALCGPLRTTLLDDIERGADDAPLLLDGAAGALLGDFLDIGRMPSVIDVCGDVCRMMQLDG